MWQWVSTSSQRVAHSFSIGLEVVQSLYKILKVSEKGLRHIYNMHAIAQTDMTVLGATSLHASRRSASDSTQCE